jgi:protein farnesyltransferase subunit beta
MSAEGGFQGRANKVVDACYSYWGGGLFPLIDRLLQMDSNNKSATNTNTTDNNNTDQTSNNNNADPAQSSDMMGEEDSGKKNKRNLRTSAISMKSLRDSIKSGMSIAEISESGEALDEISRMNSVDMKDWNPNESGVLSSESMDEEEIDEISIAENLINMKHRTSSGTFDRPAGWLFNQKMLQQYLLCCAQERNGGLRDKPGK